VKTVHIVSIVTVLAVVFLSIGLVSALSSSDVVIHASLSNPTPRAGDMVLVSVTFQSNVAQELKIYAIGVHADWMDATQLYGPNLSSDPQTVEANGVYSTQFSLPIPSSASVGTHTFTIGVDGLDASGNAFSLDSAQSQVQVLDASSSTGPGTTNPNGQTGTSDWLPYLVVAAAAVVVVVLVLLVMMRSRKGRKPAVQSSSEAPVSPEPEAPKPDHKPESQDFNI
jgi:preprotein translocase subunit SecG